MTKKELVTFHRALHRWYKNHGRTDLPWRNTDDPYAIYISEIMLQQTQVKTVLERFYFPFLKRFPTIKALAKAKHEDILHQWQGLGYYSRARNLHEAAKHCKTQLPNSVEELIALPGIGRNTAHAIAAFGFHQSVPVMEANLRRVLARIFALKTPTENILWDKAYQLLDTKHPFDYNQAMMDIGALICRKQNPSCADCPARPICKGQKNPQAYPASSAKKQVPVRKKYIVLLEDEHGRFYKMIQPV